MSIGRGGRGAGLAPPCRADRAALGRGAIAGARSLSGAEREAGSFWQEGSLVGQRRSWRVLSLCWMRQGDSERLPRLFSLLPGLPGGVHSELSPTRPWPLRRASSRPAGLGRGTEQRGSQTRRKAEPRGRELTGRTETGMAKPVAMLPGLGSLAGHPASGLRSWAEMESAWTERALTFHRLGFGAEVGLQVPSGFPLSACGWKWVCARVCVHTCVSVLRNCCVENVTTWITVP